jgi:hypothetical protein
MGDVKMKAFKSRFMARETVGGRGPPAREKDIFLSQNTVSAIIISRAFKRPFFCLTHHILTLRYTKAIYLEAGRVYR